MIRWAAAYADQSVLVCVHVCASEQVWCFQPWLTFDLMTVTVILSNTTEFRQTSSHLGKMLRCHYSVITALFLLVLWFMCSLALHPPPPMFPTILMWFCCTLSQFLSMFLCLLCSLGLALIISSPRIDVWYRDYGPMIRGGSILCNCAKDGVCYRDVHVECRGQHFQPEATEKKETSQHKHCCSDWQHVALFVT